MGLKSNFFYNSIITSANYLFPLIVFPYVSRILGPHYLGIFNFVDSVIYYFYMFGMMGIGIIGVREIAAVQHDMKKRNEVFSSLLFLNAIFVATVIVLLIICIQIIPTLNQYKYLFVVGGYSPNNNENRKAVEKIMQLVVADKKVFFHCAVGTDRTGTIAMFLEGILGVSNGNIHDDYELSYFRRQVSNSGKTRTNGSFVSLFNSVQKQSGNGQEKFINWFLSKSSDKNRDLKLINDFRKKMIDGNPTTYKLSNGTLVKG